MSNYHTVCRQAWDLRIGDRIDFAPFSKKADVRTVTEIKQLFPDLWHLELAPRGVAATRPDEYWRVIP